ncbi:unnamed protein product [Choristocarpus tenellus]
MGVLRKILKKFKGGEWGKARQKFKDDFDLDDNLRTLFSKIDNTTKRNILLKFGDQHQKSILQGQEQGDVVHPNVVAPRDGVEVELASEDKDRSPKMYARELVMSSIPKIKILEALRVSIKAADDEWIKTFKENDGMAGIYKVMAEVGECREDYLEEGDDDNERVVPQEDIELEEELVHCLMLLMNKPVGLTMLGESTDLMPLLAVS